MQASSYKYNVFISGHRDITNEEFDKYYIKQIQGYVNWLKTDHSNFFNDKSLIFYVGDCDGCDCIAINYIINEILPLDNNIKLVICTCDFNFDGKQTYNFNNSNISIIGGFKSHEERDSYMTKSTDADLLWIRQGKWDSGTAQNYVKRVWMER